MPARLSCHATPGMTPNARGQRRALVRPLDRRCIRVAFSMSARSPIRASFTASVVGDAFATCCPSRSANESIDADERQECEDWIEEQKIYANVALTRAENAQFHCKLVGKVCEPGERCKDYDKPATPREHECEHDCGNKCEKRPADKDAEDATNIHVAPYTSLVINTLYGSST